MRTQRFETRLVQLSRRAPMVIRGTMGDRPIGLNEVPFLISRNESSMKAKKRRPLAANVRWAIYLIRKRAERIGSVIATDQDDAVQRGIAQLQISERDCWRVSAQPVQ
jgi:hypothetical protein